MADSEKPRGDQVAEKDAGGDDEGVQFGERNVVVHMVRVTDNGRSVASMGSKNSGEKIRPREGRRAALPNEE